MFLLTVSRGHPEGGCNPSLCKNGATCKFTGTFYECLCTPPFVGDLCQFWKCLTNDGCFSGGTCVNGRCLCPDGYNGDVCECKYIYSKADLAPARRAHAPLFEIFYWCIFWNFDSKTHKHFIVINMQCLQYVFYSLLSLQKHRVCVKGHQNNLQTSNTIPRRDRAPRFLNFWIRHWY